MKEFLTEILSLDFSGLDGRKTLSGYGEFSSKRSTCSINLTSEDLREGIRVVELGVLADGLRGCV